MFQYTVPQAARSPERLPHPPSVPSPRNHRQSPVSVPSTSPGVATYFAANGGRKAARGTDHSAKKRTPLRLHGVLRRAGSPSRAGVRKVLGSECRPGVDGGASGEDSRLPHSSGLIKRVRDMKEYPGGWQLNLGYILVHKLYGGS